MGIKDLNTFLGKDIKEIFPLQSLRGKRIAVDALNWWYTYMSTAFKIVVNSSKELEVDQAQVFKILVEEMISFCTKLMENYITPVLVWDGVHDQLKLEAKVERRKLRQEQLRKCDTLKEQILSSNLFSRDPELFQKWLKLYPQVARLDEDYLNSFKEVISSLGIPSIQAPSDAENLCAFLNITHRVVGVWSRDSDLYALGTPLVITKINFDTQTFEGVLYSKVLEKSELNPSLFLDMCIALGCDYNNRIPRVGPVKISKLLKEKGHIENWGIDYSCLNLEKCRILLSPESVEIPEEILNLNHQVCVNQGREILYFYDLPDSSEKICNLILDIQANDTN